ncbi:hypothetical protein IV01_24325 [Pseudomonas syringae]|uniref:Uncharacterized protein n=1 Tax=Pseudomonas syringae TaxID=317 RepID=A0A085V7G6_PSESX|nr:hypothetical protein IV01_24325 [Pseudomonas syringae]
MGELRMDGGKAGGWMRTYGNKYDVSASSGVGYTQTQQGISFAHEFANNNKVQVNNNVFNNDLSGSRGELGAGVAIQLTDKLQAHVDLDYSNGNNIEQPWGANVGLRYSW